jgi:hypothetical protein
MKKLLLNWLGKTSAPGWEHPYDVQGLRNRLAGLDAKDPLFPLLLGFLDAQIVAAAEAQLSSDATAQFAGRLKAFADTKAELANVWRQSHP